MKLLLLTFVVCFAAVLAAPADKQKRDILPGDPRYGTEHHHHHEHENEVQILKAAGGYIGSYTVADDTEVHSFQVQPQQLYGPSNYAPSKPLGNEYLAASDTDKIPASALVPSTSYGIPDITQEQPKFDIVHVQKTVPEVHHVQQPEVSHKHETVHNHLSLPQVKVTASHLPAETQGAVQQNVPSLTSSINTFPNYASYSSYSNIPLKTVDHHVQVHVPQPYTVPVTKHVAVPVPVPHAVEVPKPYYVRVPQPIQVPVDRPYPVEVPRPIPYPVHHFIKTSVPVAQPIAQPISQPFAQPIAQSIAQPIVEPIAQRHHVTLDTKANPFQTFLDNSQLTFQNVLTSLPTFSNPLENIPNPFENFEFPSLPFVPSSLPSIPSIPFLPQQPQTLGKPTSSDSVTVDNPVLKTETTVAKPSITKPAKQVYKPSTACAGCNTASSSKKEYVQPTDANGGYVY